MSGLVNGLQNRLRRFESARHLHKEGENPNQYGVLAFLFSTNRSSCVLFLDKDAFYFRNSLYLCSQIQCIPNKLYTKHPKQLHDEKEIFLGCDTLFGCLMGIR